ncbi:hypothetical protein DV736_g2186, partial [Chaetothyriales sp. CBS 134916]
MVIASVDIGTFDEESCRYFLREVGERVVPAYPFGYGMEEVYSLILEKYGYAGIRDALSLLQELLEDDDVAAGVGDDGDIWRSWRHQWARRNRDPLNPYIPRIGRFVLPDPTPKHIRNLKADAFLRLENSQKPSISGLSQQNVTAEAEGKSSPEASTPDSAVAIQPTYNFPDEDRGISTTKTTYSHQRCRLGLPHFHDSPRHGQMAGHPHDYLQSYPASPRSTADSQQNVAYATSSLRQSGPDFSHFVPFERMGSLQVHLAESTDRQGRTAKIQALPQNSSSLSRSSLQRDIGSKEHNQSQALSQPGCIRAVNKKSHRSRLSCSGERLDQEDFNTVPNKPVSETRLSAASNLQRCFIAEPIEHRITPEPQRKAVHRNTTLIDGIFNNSIRRTGREVDRPEAQETRASKRSSKFLDWVAGQPKNNRRSWLQGVKSLLGATREKPSSTADVLTNTDYFSVIGADPYTLQQSSSMQMNKNASSPSPTPLANPRFLLDGACDEQISLSSSGSYLNKPLPLTPSEIVKSLSSRTRSNSHSRTRTQESPRASTTSTSNTPKKEELPAMTRDLRRFETMKTAESSVYETDRRYLRHVISPPNHQRTPNLSEQETSNSGPPPSAPMFYNTQGISESPPSSSPEPAGKEDELRDQRSVKPSSDSFKNTRNQQSVNSTPKRSQSPMKRMLGFAKTKTPESGPEKQAIPNSSSKRSLKQWTNKFRHGFLTADEEEAQREAQIENYMESVSNPVPAQLATFPISLDPAHQARLQADIELMIVVSANRFLLKEAEAGRLNPATVSATRDAWEKRNLPQVLEYLYDQATQRHLILANFQTLNFYGSGTPDPIGLNSTIYSWGVLVREMSVRTFCAGDSVIRKWLNDARRVLELLGAPLITFLAFQELEVKTLACISQKQYKRLRDGINTSGAEHRGVVPRRDWSATSNYGLNHRRNMSDGSHKYSALPAGLEHLNLSPTPGPTPTSRRSNSVKSRKPTGFTSTPLANSYSAGTMGDTYGNSSGRLRQDIYQGSHIPTMPSGQIQTAARRFQGEGEAIPLRRSMWSDRR